jgi:Outer membrane protein beta-barrel domain
MKHLLSATVLLLATAFTNAQTNTDSTTSKADTVRVGNFVIIKKEKGSTVIENNNKKDGKGINITIGKNKFDNKKNISTNWWIFDLGFANYRDQTNYSNAVAGNFLRTVRAADGAVNAGTTTLNTTKSSNFNIWFFMQKLNVSKHVINLKYGLGLEMYNFRYDSRVSFRRDGSNMPYAFVDSINFSKNKLYAGYITVPLMLNINPTPEKRNGFSASIGVSAGYLISSRNKQISGERGKQKYNGDLGLEPFRFAGIGELGLGPVRLYGSYSFNTLHKSATRIEQYPYTIGVRFSRW